MEGIKLVTFARKLYNGAMIVINFISSTLMMLSGNLIKMGLLKMGIELTPEIL